MKRAANLALLCLSACAAQSFQPQFKARPMPSEQTVLAEVSAGKPRDERPVAVGITSAPERLFAWDLSAGVLWERTVRAKSAPIVVADAIVLAEADGITVRDLASGDVRAVIDDEGELVGADGEGRALVVSISYQGSDARSAIVYVDGTSVRWRQSLQLPAGIPALINGRVLVPWATQRLSVLDARDGAELVRWHMNNTVLGHVRVDRGRVYVGQLGLMRLDSQILQKGTDPALYTPFKRSLPGQPAMLRDGYAKVPEPDNAQHRLQLDWRIGAGGAEMSAENDLLALRFYRLLFALDARSDAIRWVRTFDHDLVGAAIEPGGLFIADSAGRLSFLDNSGVTRMERDLGRPLQVLSIRPGGWVPAAAAPPAPAAQPGAPADAAAPAASPATGGETPPSMREQLYAAATLADDRIGAGRAYAVEHLARMPDDAVTTHLVAVCSDRKSPEPVQLAACSHLGERANGGDQIVEALRRRASFLEGAEPPPVGALAKAAGQMQLKQAAPLLVSHMEDPNTDAADLVPLLETLARLGHKPAAGAIERFVRMHHAEPEGSELQPALLAAMHALGTLRARGSRGSLDDLARDPLTPQPVRDRAREAIALMDAPAAAKPDAAPARAAPAEEEAEPEEEVQTDPRPYSLTPEMVRDALKPLRGKLAGCVAADGTKPHSGRVSMVVNGEGRVEGVFVTPTTLQACIEAGLQEARLPPTRVGRQRVTHTVFGPNATKDAKASKTGTSKARRPAARPGKK
jgi:hypothetical protein